MPFWPIDTTAGIGGIEWVIDGRCVGVTLHRAARTAIRGSKGKVMGDTFRDPLDHQRSSRPRVGQTLKNPAKLPGLVLVAVGVVALGICLVSFACQQVGTAVVAAAIALLALATGLAWLAREARRLRELEGQPDSNHRDRSE